MKQSELKNPYTRIDFINCDLDYNYTICPWSDVPDQLLIAESNFAGIDESETVMPEIKLSVVFLTDKEFGEEIAKWDM